MTATSLRQPSYSVLLVGRHASLMRALSFRLEMEQHQVHTASTDSAALTMMRDVRPDIVISDEVGLPNGALPFSRYRGVPCIVLSSQEDEGHCSHRMELDAMLPKPIDAEALLQTIHATMAAASGLSYIGWA